jgi:hypothetical protein
MPARQAMEDAEIEKRLSMRRGAVEIASTAANTIM